jgi:Ca2+-binding RTX toxin-like protein
MNTHFDTTERAATRLRLSRRRRKQLQRAGLVAAASAAVFAGLAVPSHAAGGSASVTAGNDVSYVGNGFANRVVVSSDLPGTVLLEEPVAGITAGPGCTQVTTTKVRCAATGSAIDFVLLELGAGFDEAKVQTPVRTTVRGGDGNDRYFGASSNNRSNVTFDGGAGIDTVDYRSSDAGVAVDIDGAADDGRLLKDTDNILTSVENLSGSDHGDSLRGNAGSNRIFGGLGADALRGGAGNDELDASEPTTPGKSEQDLADLSCGTGLDSIRLDVVDPGTAECEIIQRVR